MGAESDNAVGRVVSHEDLIGRDVRHRRLGASRKEENGVSLIVSVDGHPVFDCRDRVHRIAAKFEPELRARKSPTIQLPVGIPVDAVHDRLRAGAAADRHRQREPHIDRTPHSALSLCSEFERLPAADTTPWRRL